LFTTEKLQEKLANLQHICGYFEQDVFSELGKNIDFLFGSQEIPVLAKTLNFQSGPFLTRYCI
jgi:hypothetical protein